jgi:general secretion pathway protein C
MMSRAEVDHQLGNLSSLFTQMRAVPNIKEGRTDGFRVFAIRSGSLFQQLGLQNNDVVQRINGVELTDPTRAMGLFEELKGEKRLSVDVLRGGETRTLSYEIR